MGESVFKLNIDYEFSSVECYKCSALFAVSRDLHQNWRNHGNTFYCPVCGSPQAYTKTRIQRMQEQLEQKERQLHQERERVEFLNRQISAQKGQNTKLKNRIAKGVCPCCKRSFKNLERHMKSKHPDYASDGND